MIFKKDNDLALISSTESCSSCIASRQGYSKTASELNSSHKHSHSRIKSSSLFTREGNMKQLIHHNPKAERVGSKSTMELYDHEDFDASWMDEEFYSTGVSSPVSPLDIWKKFDLGSLPTPPSSPEHEPDESSDGLSLDCQIALDERISGGLLDFLDDVMLPAVSTVPESCEKCGPLNTKLIQDCMWSATQPNLTETVLKKTSSTSTSSSKNSTRTDINSNSSSMCNRNRTDSCSGDVPNSSECVDPTSVFPYPLSEPLVKGGLVGAHSCMDTPSPSESEDEEEIDVVTVTTITRRTSSRPAPQTQVSMSAQVAAMHNYSNSSSSGQSSASHHSDHHYSQPYTQSAPQSPANQRNMSSTASPTISVLKRSRPMSMPCSPQPPSKRHRSGMNESDLKRACQKLYPGNGRSSGRSGRSSGGSSRTSSDSEEGEGKRAQHNVLERKRRNDLKYSFCTLRACVPEISQSERTPKVTILKKASDYITSMKKRYNALEAEHTRQKHRQEQLKAKLAQLRRSDLSFL